MKQENNGFIPAGEPGRGGYHWKTCAEDGGTKTAWCGGMSWKLKQNLRGICSHGAVNEDGSLRSN